MASSWAPSHTSSASPLSLSAIRAALKSPQVKTIDPSMQPGASTTPSRTPVPGSPLTLKVKTGGLSLPPRKLDHGGMPRALIESTDGFSDRFLSWRSRAHGVVSSQESTPRGNKADGGKEDTASSANNQQPPKASSPIITPAGGGFDRYPSYSTAGGSTAPGSSVGGESLGTSPMLGRSPVLYTLNTSSPRQKACSPGLEAGKGAGGEATGSGRATAGPEQGGEIAPVTCETLFTRDFGTTNAEIRQRSLELKTLKASLNSTAPTWHQAPAAVAASVQEPSPKRRGSDGWAVIPEYRIAPVVEECELSDSDESEGYQPDRGAVSDNSFVIEQQSPALPTNSAAESFFRRPLRSSLDLSRQDSAFDETSKLASPRRSLPPPSPAQLPAASSGVHSPTRNPWNKQTSVLHGQTSPTNKRRSPMRPDRRRRRDEADMQGQGDEGEPREEGHVKQGAVYQSVGGRRKSMEEVFMGMSSTSAKSQERYRRSGSKPKQSGLQVNTPNALRSHHQAPHNNVNFDSANFYTVKTPVNNMKVLSLDSNTPRRSSLAVSIESVTNVKSSPRVTAAFLHPKPPPLSLLHPTRTPPTYPVQPFAMWEDPPSSHQGHTYSSSDESQHPNQGTTGVGGSNVLEVGVIEARNLPLRKYGGGVAPSPYCVLSLHQADGEGDGAALDFGMKARHSVCPQHTTASCQGASNPHWGEVVALRQAFFGREGGGDGGGGDEKALGNIRGETLHLLLTIQDAASERGGSLIGQVALGYISDGTVMDRWLALQLRDGSACVDQGGNIACVRISLSYLPHRNMPFQPQHGMPSHTQQQQPPPEHLPPSSDPSLSAHATGAGVGESSRQDMAEAHDLSGVSSVTVREATFGGISAMSDPLLSMQQQHDNKARLYDKTHQDIENDKWAGAEADSLVSHYAEKMMERHMGMHTPTHASKDKPSSHRKAPSPRAANGVPAVPVPGEHVNGSTQASERMAGSVEGWRQQQRDRARMVGSGLQFQGATQESTALFQEADALATLGLKLLQDGDRSQALKYIDKSWGMLKGLSTSEKASEEVWRLLSKLLKSGCIPDGDEIQSLQAEARRSLVLAGEQKYAERLAGGSDDGSNGNGNGRQRLRFAETKRPPWQVMTEALEKLHAACESVDSDELERQYKRSKKAANSTILSEWKKGFSETRSMSAGDAAARVRERQEMSKDKKKRGENELWRKERGVRWAEVEEAGAHVRRREAAMGGGFKGIASLLDACKEFSGGERGRDQRGGVARLGHAMDEVMLARERDADEVEERREALMLSGRRSKELSRISVNASWDAENGWMGGVPGKGVASVVGPSDIRDKARREGDRVSLLEERLKVLEAAGEGQGLRSPRRD